MSRLSDTFARALAHRPWVDIARPAQLPPTGDAWRVWLLLGGRGSGKTRAAAEWITSQIMGGVARRVAIVGRTVADVRDVMVSGDSGLVSVAPPYFRPAYSPSLRKLEWPNGATATTFSSDEADQLRGPQHDCSWVDELCTFEKPDELWSTLMLGLRLGQARCVVSTTPRPIPILKTLVSRDGRDVVVRKMTTYENLANLAPAFAADIVSRYANTTVGRQELLAEILSDLPGALWSVTLLDGARKEKPPTRRVQDANGQWHEVFDFRRIVIGVDPSVGTSENAGECGVVVCALGRDGHGYVLEDGSLAASPDTWARRAVTLYHKWRADRVVAEVNMGGALVRRVLETVEPNLPVTTVHAARSKGARAEPIAALFEQNRAHMVGTFPALEEQLTCWLPGSGESPDRLDAMVWALTSLFMVPPTLSERLEAMTDQERRDYHANQAALAARIFEIS